MDLKSDNKVVFLSDIPTGGECIIIKVRGHGSFRHRIIEMGFVKGERVKVIKNAPLNDPIEYQLMNGHLSLRRSEAQLIEVVDLTAQTVCFEDEPHHRHHHSHHHFREESHHQHHHEHHHFRDTDESENISFPFEDDYAGTLVENEVIAQIIREKSYTINVALVGNPNCGKTSLFNRATGMREKVGNYSGVTVGAKIGKFHHDGYTINFIDLPGTYSITEYSPEELYVRKYLTEEHPDIVLNVVDASNLERNLFLTSQLIDMNLRMVMALNMYDELAASGDSLNYKYLGQLLGFPIVPTTASKGIGMDELFDHIIDVFEDKSTISRHIHINYGNDIEDAINAIKLPISENKNITDKFSTRFLSIKLIENDGITKKLLEYVPNYSQIIDIAQRHIQKLEKAYKEDTRTIITNAKYGFIRGALKETFKTGEEKKRQVTDSIDKILTHKWFGFPILLLFLFIMFQATFSLGQYPMDWIENGVNLLENWMSNVIPQGWVHDLVIDGIIAGVGGVIVFLPNIIILFMFISFMEDTGYMARAAFIMDKMMHRIGLHGKSFIPLLMGFGCNVPAITATRIIEGRRDRLITILITPFMSCSARLPVYILLISAFFPKNQAIVLFSIYLIGILVACIAALLMNKFMSKKEAVPFVMELPPYRIPTFRNALIHTWDKSAEYLKKMGTVILLAAVVIWALGYFPQNVEYSQNWNEQIANIENNTQLSDSLKTSQIHLLDSYKRSEHLAGSYIGQLGHFVAPVIKPLGFDWKMGVSILAGLGAKEIVVSTMGILYHSDDSGENLALTLQQQTYISGDKKGEKIFTPLVAYAFMLFVLLYFPCMAVIAAVRREGGGKWALFTMFYTTAVAWLVACLVYQIGSLLL